MMFKNPALRLSIPLTLLTINLLFLANIIGFFPDEIGSALELRKSLSESLALQFSVAAEKGELQTVQSTLRLVVERNDDIRSAAIRSQEGKLIALAGEHLAHWNAPPDGKSTPTHVHVPVYRQGKRWATVEIRFAPLWVNNLASGFTHSFGGLLTFIAVSSFLCYFIVMKRTLRELDPSAVIPERVQKAFDVLQEGVLIQDEKEQIVMANKSFASLFGKTPEAMIGLKGSELGWLDYQNPEQIRKLPWLKVLREDREYRSASLNLMSSHGSKIKLAVKAITVTDNSGECHGTLVTFNDITQLEETNFELSDMVDRLQLANDEIHEKSQELEFLANRDPMTQCLNRRALDRNLNKLFTESKATGRELSCLMADIDFFKSVNDRYGHATGDQVIKAVADVLRLCTRDSDLVGRYGGEEFCVVLPDRDQKTATKVAERIREEIEKSPCGGVKITVSLGVSSLVQQAGRPDELVNQADKALYAAKEGGRNRVVSWGVAEPVTTELSTRALVEKIQLTTSSDDHTETMTNQTHLLRRIQELEGLLEKRTLEFTHYKTHDLLTGLPTRSLFDDRIFREITRIRRKNSDSMVVVLSMTIETIKRVYESLGHSAAEQLAKACGSRINDVLREDIDTVAMINEDEEFSSVYMFNQTELGLLLTDIKQIDHVTWVIKRLQDAFESPFEVKDQEIYASAYIGISIFPHDGQTVEDLYNSAVSACSYAEKNNGSTRYMFASQNINAVAVRQLQIESCLRGAIENNELQLYFQPQVETSTGRVAGFEVLLRWQNPQLGFVPPSDFIPVAEQSGQINQIGYWVLYGACKQLREWLDSGLDVGSLAVNVSGVQLCQPDLAQRIQEILTEFDLDYHLLEIELTESSLVNSVDKSFAVLKQIKELGMQITIDDFGTGYSSFSYIKDMPLSCIKIDRSFVADIGKDANAEKLIASIVSMAHGLELKVVAEGIEEQHQAEHLATLGCELLQGYLYSHPVPQEEVAKVLNQNTMKLIEAS